MSLERCRAAFALQPSKEIALRLHEATTDLCGCEAHSMADESPGVVDDGETLHLIISDPTDLNAGFLNPASLVRIDTSGVSVASPASSGA